MQPVFNVITAVVTRYIDDSSLGTPKEALRWWERRRLVYNLVLLAVGVCSCLLCVFVGSLAVQGGEDFVEPLALFFGVPIVAVGANICYFAGWAVDVLYFIGRPNSGKQRSILFLGGFAFSVLVVASPGAWAVFAWITTIVTGKKLE